jgi:hypothetical protein
MRLYSLKTFRLPDREEASRAGRCFCVITFLDGCEHSATIR